jgi:hypothetical protein
MGSRLELAEELIALIVNGNSLNIFIPFLHANGKTEMMTVDSAK